MYISPPTFNILSIVENCSNVIVTVQLPYLKKCSPIIAKTDMHAKLSKSLVVFHEPVWASYPSSTDNSVVWHSQIDQRVPCHTYSTAFVSAFRMLMHCLQKPLEQFHQILHLLQNQNLVWIKSEVMQNIAKTSVCNASSRISWNVDHCFFLTLTTLCGV